LAYRTLTTHAGLPSGARSDIYSSVYITDIQ